VGCVIQHSEGPLTALYTHGSTFNSECWRPCDSDHCRHRLLFRSGVPVTVPAWATKADDMRAARMAAEAVASSMSWTGWCCLLIIKKLSELAEPDEASLVIRPLGIDPGRVAEGVAEHRQNLIASFELADAVPDTTRASYDRVRAIYSYGIFCYDLYTVAGNQARLVAEQALRERFLPFYGGTVTFADRQGHEHRLTPVRFSDLFDRDDPRVLRGWRLKLRSGRLIAFNGMLTALLRWAREERLLGGQRDRWQDRFRITFRNYAAHSEYHREMPDDAAAEIFHLSQLINQIWGASGGTHVRREILALAWTDTSIMYGFADAFRVDDRMPAHSPCVLLRADPLDRTLGNSFDTRYELTARPFEYLWGPGAWPDAAQWLSQEQPAGDEVPALDRLFLLRYHDNRLCMPQRARIAAALDRQDAEGRWYLLRADYPQTPSATSVRSSPGRAATPAPDSAASAPQRASRTAPGRK